MRYMVSFQYFGGLYNGLSGNRTFDEKEQAIAFIASNKHEWKSHSLFVFNDGEAIATLTEIAK